MVINGMRGVCNGVLGFSMGSLLLGFGFSKILINKDLRV